MRIICTWHPIWYSKYDRGQIESIDGLSIERIYRNRHTGQIRVYSREPLDGAPVVVNASRIVLRSRGRFGLLYIGE